jgi:peptidoglycan/xylan/chitin deacetylase (PgdA/CDA1 family)
VAQVITSCPPKKRRLAAMAHAIGATAAASAWERRKPTLRVVNSHSVPPRFEQAFTAHVQALSRTWQFASPADLLTLLEEGPSRPTLLFCFDDGLANAIANAAPILEDAGARAIFAVPAAWPDVAVDNRAAWFRRHVYPVPTELHAEREDIAAPSWDGLRDLVHRGHEVWSHGFDHLRLRADTSQDALHREIVSSKELLERQLGAPVRGYCPPMSYTVPPRALALISSTYELAFGGRPAPVPVGGDRFRIPRSNIEASWSRRAVAFQLSPLGDALTHALEGLRS